MKQEEVTPDETELTKKTVSAILQNGVKFEVTVVHKNILHKIGIIPSARTFIVYPLVLGCIFRIAEIIDSIKAINLDPTSEVNLSEIGIKSIVQNKDKLLRAVVYGIMNKDVKSFYDKTKMKFIISYIDKNISTKELLQLVMLITSQMGVEYFLASTVSMTKLNLIGTGHMKEEKKEL